jgi:hypothetical protein
MIDTVCASRASSTRAGDAIDSRAVGPCVPGTSRLT